ncbi:hypothetical protein JOF44_004156 [Brachybacterium fresconis]|uniref:Uncharacterized protein n=1 Tax=Brachybacterium fresconis TaxID=173363 RepID=A0ABS4YQW5_9MICO|nr:hypothetical protein [Brachybacterium fresconis]
MTVYIGYKTTRVMTTSAAVFPIRLGRDGGSCHAGR